MKPLEEGLLDAIRQRLGVWNLEPSANSAAVKPRGSSSSARVAAGLADDPIPDPLV